MPTVQEIELAAAKLRQANRRVSVRNVRDVLPRGGSHTDIGPPLAAWKANVNYRAKELPKEIPAGLAPVIEEFAAKLWAAAREEAETVVEARLRQQAELERVHEVEAGIAWAEADRLTDELRRLRGLLREAGHEVGPMLPPMPSREARDRAREAWGATEESPPFDERVLERSGVAERVGQRAAKAIAKSGKEALTVAQLLPRMGGLLDMRREPLTKERLAYFLDRLAAESRHVRKLADGRFACLRPATAPKPVPPTPAPRAQEPPKPRRRRRPHDRIIEELLAPLEAGWTPWKHLVADGITSRKFWDGVMGYSAGVVAASDREVLSAEEILAALPAEVIAKAAEFEPLTAGVLREKLAFRSTKNKYVIDLEDGTFAVRPYA